MKAFRSVGSQLGVNLNLLHEVEQINLRQRERFVAKIRAALWTLRGKKIAVLGLAFKGGTDDLRESPAIEIVQALLCEGSSIVAYDPAAMPNAERLFQGRITLVQDVYATAENADALLILTDWKEFAELDLLKLKRLLRYPIVVDGRNLYNPEVMQQHGFTYVSIGRPMVVPRMEAAGVVSSEV